MRLRLNNFTAIGLLETLATILIVSISVFGLIKLQLFNIKYLSNSTNTLKASFYAENLINRIQINETIAKSSSSAYVLSDYTNTASPVASSALCISSSCDANNLAVHDMNIWLYQIKNNLPNGQAKVTKETSSGYTIYTISIKWMYKTESKVYESYVQL